VKTCIPADALLWALVATIRDGAHVATDEELRGLLGSGCPRERVREVLARAAAENPDKPFAQALARLDAIAS
jgi:hypothetical protein